MKKYLFILGLVFGLNFTGVAQDLNNYKYVRVPEKFLFQKDENKYRLNELLAFLLEKEDFQALYKEPVPPGISACDILDADVQNESGLFKSKVFFTLKDCKNNIVFTSKTGVSRKKDFRDGFQEALRKAFKSLEKLHHQYEPGPGTVIVNAVPSEEKEHQLEKKKKEQVLIFVNGGKNYVLKPTVSGFDLFEQDEKQLFAKLVKSGGGDTYLYTSEKINGNAFFDAQENLVVEYLNEGQLVNLTYRKVQ